LWTTWTGDATFTHESEVTGGGGNRSVLDAREVRKSHLGLIQWRRKPYKDSQGCTSTLRAKERSDRGGGSIKEKGRMEDRGGRRWGTGGGQK